MAETLVIAIPRVVKAPISLFIVWFSSRFDSVDATGRIFAVVIFRTLEGGVFFGSLDQSDDNDFTGILGVETPHAGFDRPAARFPISELAAAGHVQRHSRTWGYGRVRRSSACASSAARSARASR